MVLRAGLAQEERGKRRSHPKRLALGIPRFAIRQKESTRIHFKKPLITAPSAERAGFGPCWLLCRWSEIQDHTLNRATALGQKFADIYQYRLDAALPNLLAQRFPNAQRHEQVELSLILNLKRICRIECRINGLQFDQIGGECAPQFFPRLTCQPIHVGKNEIASGPERAQHRISVVVGLKTEFQGEDLCVSCDLPEFAECAIIRAEPIHTLPGREADPRHESLPLDSPVGKQQVGAGWEEICFAL